MLYRYRLFLLALVCCGGLSAQNCNYQLLLEDSFGDGWNGALLTVRIDGIVDTFTITNDLDTDGRRRVIFLPVTDGQTIEIGFTEGAFPLENSFTLFDNADVPLYVSGLPIEEGDIIFSTEVICQTCFSPPANSVDFFRIRSATIDYRFNGANPTSDPVYRIEFRDGDDYDPAVDDDGVVFFTPDTTDRVTGLEPDTSYTFWISTICRAETDTAIRRGPFTVRTQKRADVGVTALRGPVDDCNLGSEEVTFGITNFGGEPQAFFNVDYQINGQAAGVTRPQDGIFTGIVGVDSTEFFTFDTRALLSMPGVYELTIWTELEGDEDPANDTTTFTVANFLIIDELPYVENFETSGGFWNPTSEEFARGENSWEWGAPAGTELDRAPQGVRAWATGLDTRYNNGEISYLNSPCFDLTDQEEDPLFSAVLVMNTENNFDRLTLEMTTDNGETWEKIETGARTINWYNNLQSQYWTGDGGFPGGGPTMVSAVLDGAAGEEIRLRFSLRSDNSVTREGILVDAVSITERYGQDLAAVTGSAFSLSDCGSPTDTVVFSFTNRGMENATDFEVNYRANGGDVVTEIFTGDLASGQSTTYQFQTAFNSNLLANNRIETWVSLPDDELPRNDTTFFFFRSLEPLPFFFDFENALAPANWDVPNSVSVRQVGGSPSVGLVDDLFLPGDTFQVVTANYGLIETGDQLRMDIFLREVFTEELYTDPVGLELRAYPDCSEDFEVLDEFILNGDTTIVENLSVFADRSVRFEVIGRHQFGNFFFILDNFGVVRCAGLELDASTTGVTNQQTADGSATVVPNAGFGPYTYEWNTGDSTAAVEELAFGDYTVTVTDAFGCTDEIGFTVDLASGVDESTEVLDGISVFPNPTAGQLELRLDLPAATALRTTLYDLTGRRLIDRDYGRRLRLAETLDLTSFPAGVYFLRVQAEDAAKTIRVIKN